jgi:signal transduction histidine kinase
MAEQRIALLRLRTWPVVALALLGLLTLIIVSILAAQRRADAAYAELDDLNSRFRQIDGRLRRVRSDLHVSGILARDSLLDSTTSAAEYRSRLLPLKNSSMAALNELRPLVRASDPARYDALVIELRDYWASYDPLFSEAQIADRYGFLRQHVVPRRDAVMEISAELESINNLNLNAQREAAASRHQELHEYLTSTLAASLTLGLLVAVGAVVRIRVLEGRSAQQHARTEQAEQEMRRLSNQLVKTQEEERKNLSRELHDELGQMLTALRMEIGRAERAQAVGSPVFASTIAESKLLLDKTMRLVRDLSMGLRPSMLDDLGLEPALAWQARDFSRRYNVPVDLKVEGDLERLPDQHRTCVYRVVQEALTNCAKHAKASEIQVAVVGGREWLDVSIRDNGVGLAHATEHAGLGLTGIRERVKEMNGSASIQTMPGGGTVLQITLPVIDPERRKETSRASRAR